MVPVIEPYISRTYVNIASRTETPDSNMLLATSELCHYVNFKEVNKENFTLRLNDFYTANFKAFWTLIVKKFVKFTVPAVCRV